MAVNGDKCAECEGVGVPATDLESAHLRNTICPECRGIAPIEHSDNSPTGYVVDYHTVKVIDFGEDES